MLMLRDGDSYKRKLSSPEVCYQMANNGMNYKQVALPPLQRGLHKKQHCSTVLAVRKHRVQ